MQGNPYLFASNPVAVTVEGGGGGGDCPEAFTDTFSIKLILTDTNAVPTDDATYAMALAQSDTNAGQTESVELKFPAGVYTEANPVPSEASNFTMRVWLSGSAGAGVDSPANANGENNGTLATVSTAALGATTETLTSEVGANIPAGVSVASAVYKGWFNATIPLGTSSAEVIARSSTGLFADVVMSDIEANYLTTPFSFDLVAAGIDTAAKLGSLRIIHTTTDVVAGVSQATITVDAGAVELAAAFS